MAVELLPFDPAIFLTDNESIVEYLTIAFESSDPVDVTRALSVVARARGGIDALAHETGIECDVLSSALTEGSSPNLSIVLKIMHALGIKLSASMVA